MSVLFIADLHLSPQTPGATRVFLDFLGGRARSARALYILGDLFEYWAGDDHAQSPFNRSIIAALHALSDSGTGIFLQHGNRDFLLGDAFARTAGVTLLPDPYAVRLDGVRFVLSHGDAMCVDDREYQVFRDEVRTPVWQERFLRLPLAERLARIEGLRAASVAAKQRKTAALMDVNEQAVQDLLREQGYPVLIHGHTHRPAHHRHHLDGRDCERWVLSDWSESHGECLVWDGAELFRETLIAAT